MLQLVELHTAEIPACDESLGLWRWLGGWMAAAVSSKVCGSRPERSSPSSISGIAVTTITHLQPTQQDMEGECRGGAPGQKGREVKR